MVLFRSFRAIPGNYFKWFCLFNTSLGKASWCRTSMPLMSRWIMMHLPGAALQVSCGCSEYFRQQKSRSAHVTRSNVLIIPVSIWFVTSCTYLYLGNDPIWLRYSLNGWFNHLGTTFLQTRQYVVSLTLTSLLPATAVPRRKTLVQQRGDDTF